MVSAGQVSWVAEAINNVARGRQFLVILFQHHPYAALDWLSRRRYHELLSSVREDRLAAIVSAHTHSSQVRKTRIANKVYPEFNVGSTTDAPPEAALFSVESVAAGFRLEFRTFPTMSSSAPTRSCESHDTRSKLQGYFLDAGECKCLIRKLAGPEQGNEWCRKFARHPHRRHGDSDKQRSDQAKRTELLLKCLAPQVDWEQCASTRGFPEDSIERWHAWLRDPSIYTMIKTNASSACGGADDGRLGPASPLHKCLAWATSKLDALIDDKQLENWTYEEHAASALDSLARTPSKYMSFVCQNGACDFTPAATGSVSP